jgi:hypothetical protein
VVSIGLKFPYSLLYSLEESATVFDHFGESGSDLKSGLTRTSIAACPVGRRDQRLLTNQPSGRTTSENLPAPDGPSH